MGGGTPILKEIQDRIALKLLKAMPWSSGVVALLCVLDDHRTNHSAKLALAPSETDFTPTGLTKLPDHNWGALHQTSQPSGGTS
jgi:hypothetical protein